MMTLTLVSSSLFSQCPVGQKEITIAITPDNYPQETSWILTANGVTVGTGTFEGATFCVDQNACVQFTINDSYGDGICCGFGNGSYAVSVNGVVEAEGGQFTTTATHSLGCPPGSSCSDPIVITEGTYTAPALNYFYSFTPSTTGMYNISTCGQSTCDTKIWVYASCTQYVNNNDNTGTLFYDDDNGGCGLQALVSAYMEAGVTYYIKIGTKNNTACASGIPFTLSFEGEVVGCTDPTACNYNPLATISDGSCLYFPNPNCPGGPDLLILESAIANSIELRTEVATTCQVEEGCMNGYGNRTVLAFDTHIKNIGELDYYVGNPTANPSQFTFQNCHGHAHYEGYAEYILYTPDGTSIPIGHKNGFCVMDLECNDGGTAQYGCSNMGISKQCGDIYNKYLECQWIDITDVEPGQYIMAVKVNWDQSPDALGRFETRYDNNWAQVCIEITEDAQGVKGFQMMTPCEPYTDCAGTPFGNAVIDCEGICGGSAVRGDLSDNGTVQTEDAQLYVAGILDESLTMTTCNDISADGILSVWDAALASNCALHSVFPNSCVFPNSVTNYAQEIEIGNIVINNVDQYVDVYVKNPNNKIIGYELNIEGLVISDVENLISTTNYPTTPQFSSDLGKIIALSYVDSMIPKNFSETVFLRIYYSSLTSEDICITSVVHALNENKEPVTVNLVDACLSVASIDEKGMPDFNVYPNPAQDLVVVSIPIKQADAIKVQVTDAMGRIIVEKFLSAEELSLGISLDNFQAGLYQVNLISGTMKKTKSLVVL